MPTDASTLFFLTILLIFVTAIVTTVVTKWARDKCLKYFNGYHVTLERTRGQTIWGQCKVFPTGVEICYDNPFVDARGRKKTSFMLYGPEMEQQLLAVFRYHHELSEPQQKLRTKQVHATFNPGPLRRAYRGVRNLVNTLRDGFNAAIGAVVTQYGRMNPASGSILTTQGTNVTSTAQALLGKFANAYEPLLEQYIGQPVILDVVDPLNPNNVNTEYTGYLAEYTQNFIAVFNVEHKPGEIVDVHLPDTDQGAELPPLPMPPPPGAPAPVLPEPLKIDHDLAIRIDGLRLKIQNLAPDPCIIRSLEREGFEPVAFGLVLPPNAIFDLPARDARAGVLKVELTRTVDVVAPRRFATVRHAGELVERKGFLDEWSIEQLPLVPKVFRTLKK